MDTKKLQSRLTIAYNALLNLLSEFEENFMVGLLVGVMVVSMVFYRFWGIPRGLLYCFDVALSPYGQFHLVSIDLFFALIPLAYYALRFEKHNGKRVLGALVFPFLVFSLHDISWLIETHFVPQIYLNGMTMMGASLEEYIHHYSKNLVNAIPTMAIFLKFKYFKINKRFLITFSGLVMFHLFNIVFQVNIYVLNGLALLIMETIDSIPYLFLIKGDSPPEKMFWGVLG